MSRTTDHLIEKEEWSPKTTLPRSENQLSYKQNLWLSKQPASYATHIRDLLLNDNYGLVSRDGGKTFFVIHAPRNAALDEEE